MAVSVPYQSSIPRVQALPGSSVAFAVFSGMLVLVTLVFRIWANIESTELGYELAKSRSQYVQLDLERREFELQRSVLMRNAHLRRRAKIELGLEPLRPDQGKHVLIQ